MEDKLIDGKKISAELRAHLKNRISVLNEKGIVPGLSVVLVGDNPASSIYVNMKDKAAKKLGIYSETIKLPSETSQQELLNLIDQLNQDTKYHGILVQLPLPDHIDESLIIKSINPLKDVDCFHPENVGRLVAGMPYVLPCTPAGIIEMLKYEGIDPQGKHVVVIGRSNIVGKPMANILIQKNEWANATVTVVHSRTKNMEEYVKNADILIAAMGKSRFVKADMVKKGAVIIDVGMNRVSADNEKGYILTGDVHFEAVLPHVSKITPVPGGVGPMTITMLLYNTVKICEEWSKQN